MVFTFLASIQGGGGLLEEFVVAIRLTAEGKEVGTPEESLGFLAPASTPGEVLPETMRSLFEGNFGALAERARRLAHEHVSHRAETLRFRRLEIDDFERIADPGAPRALGAVFLLPEGVE